MSGGTYDESKTYRSPSYTEATDSTEKARRLKARGTRVEELRESVGTKAHTPRPTHDSTDLYDPAQVRKVITRPSSSAERVYIFLIDNSGSNHAIATHFRSSTNYLKVNLALIDPRAQYVFEYFSDHMDGDEYSQPIDYVFPDTEGETVLTSTLRHVADADGGDAAEAHECVLHEICEIDFGSAKERHLILITDVAGHGMGMTSDRGCIHQRDWRTSLREVDQTFTTFELIGCGDNPLVAEIQRQFIAHLHPELLAANFVSLAHISEQRYRLGIVLNAALFLVARHRGVQNLEAFLSRLYEKWLDDPIFGHETDRRAKEAILRFAKYIPQQRDELVSMMSRVLAISAEEVNSLMKQGAVLI